MLEQIDFGTEANPDMPIPTADELQAMVYGESTPPPTMEASEASVATGKTVLENLVEDPSTLVDPAKAESAATETYTMPEGVDKA